MTKNMIMRFLNNPTYKQSQINWNRSENFIDYLKRESEDFAK